MLMLTYVCLNRGIMGMADDVEVSLGGVDQGNGLRLLLGELIGLLL